MTAAPSVPPGRRRNTGRDVDVERLRHLVAGIDAIVWEMEIATCRYTYVSPAAEGMLGYPVGRWLDDPRFDATIIHPEDWDRVRTVGETAARSGRDHQVEYRAVTADGRVRWLRDQIRVIPAAGGRPALLRGVTVDITEQREAQRALGETEERLREIAGCVRDVFYTDDVVAKKYLYISPSYEAMWGRSCDSLYADYDAWREALHPDDRPRIEAAFERLEAGGFQEEWKEEYRVVHPDGTVRWVWDSTHPVRDATGRVRRMVGSSRDITERKQWEAVLRETQERYEILSQATNDAIWDYDLVTGRVVWNSAVTTLFGYEAEAVGAEATWWVERIHPAERDRVWAGVHAVLDGTGNAWKEEYRFRRSDGSYAEVLDRGYVIRDAAGRPIRMMGSMQDISPRKEAERALRESEERYAIVARATNDAIWDWDLRTDTVRWNEGIRTKFGYASEQVRPEGAWGDSLIHPEDAPHILKRMWAAARGGDPYWSLEYRFRRADGSYAWVIDRAFALRDESGRAVRIIGSMMDITERRRAEEALREAEARYRSLFENSLYGIGRATPGGRVLEANPALARILGYDSPEDLVASIQDLSRQVYADPGKREEMLRLVAERGAISGFEIRAYRRDGTIIWLQASVRAERDAGGRILHLEGTVQDVTERKRTEQALQDMTARLMRSQDEERRRIARELHDSTAQVLAALAMNLAAVSRLATNLPKAARRPLDASLALAEQCVQEMRTLSYLLHPPLLEEAGLAAAMRIYAGGFAERSGIRIEMKVPRRLGRLPRDLETTVFRILQECLTNIHRHSGSATAAIELARQDGHLSMIVRDRGRGIATSSAGRRAGNRASVGVGIAGMQERVRQLGGSLEIESRGEGTTVRMLLPLPRSLRSRLQGRPAGSAAPAASS
jgi:PAS domain S-box-containing protein